LRLVRVRICPAAVTALLLLFGAAGAASAATPRITFYFGLARPEAAARTAFFAVEQPDSSSYRRFLTPASTAARYGASPTVRARFRRAIRRLGFSARIDPSRVFARVTGPVTRFAQVFKVRIRRSAGDAGVVSYGTTGRPQLPAGLRPLVRDVVFSYLRQGSEGTGRKPSTTRAAASAGPKRSGSWIRGCAKAKRTGGFSYGQVRHAYGVDGLGNGDNATVAILGLQEVPSAQDIADNERCFHYAKLRSRTLLTDGHKSYLGLTGYRHDPRIVGKMAAHVVLPWTHRAFSLMKRWSLGTYHGLRRKHVDTYLNEFVFRYNRRFYRHVSFETLLWHAVHNEPASYWDIIKRDNPRKRAGRSLAPRLLHIDVPESTG